MAEVHASSYPEALAEERGTEVPDSDLGVMGLCRRKLLHGEALTSREYAQGHGCSQSIVGQAITQLETLGFHIERTTEQFVSASGIPHGQLRYRVTNLSHQPTTAQFDALVNRAREMQAKAKAKREAAKKARRAEQKKRTATAAVEKLQPAPAPEPEPNGHLPDTGELPPLPDLGQHLRVYALVENPDGTISVGLQNGQRQWLTTVTATSQR